MSGNQLAELVKVDPDAAVVLALCAKNREEWARVQVVYADLFEFGGYVDRDGS